MYNPNYLRAQVEGDLRVLFYSTEAGKQVVRRGGGVLLLLLLLLLTVVVRLPGGVLLGDARLHVQRCPRA